MHAPGLGICIPAETVFTSSFGTYPGKREKSRDKYLETDCFLVIIREYKQYGSHIQNHTFLV
jgi:hypothetical protein